MTFKPREFMTYIRLQHIFSFETGFEKEIAMKEPPTSHLDVIKTIDDNDDVQDFSEDSDAEVEVITIMINEIAFFNVYYMKYM